MNATKNVYFISIQKPVIELKYIKSDNRPSLYFMSKKYFPALLIF